MPALPAIANVLRIALQGVTGEATELPWANILHAAYTGTTPSNAVASAIATAIREAWTTHMAPEAPSNVSLNEVKVEDLTSPTSAVGADFTTVVGSRGDDEIPAQVAYLVDYPIGTRYRGGHPRQYLVIGGNADFLDAAHWSNAFTAEAIAHWHDFCAAWIGATFSGTTLSQMGSVSYISKEVNPVPPYRRTTPLFYPITLSTMIGEQQMATQRRRVGRHRR